MKLRVWFSGTELASMQQSPGFNPQQQGVGGRGRTYLKRKKVRNSDLHKERKNSEERIFKVK
jgi:hypothetical protein